jgi:hypothetical protein
MTLPQLGDDIAMTTQSGDDTGTTVTTQLGNDHNPAAPLQDKPEEAPNDSIHDEDDDGDDSDDDGYRFQPVTFVENPSLECTPSPSFYEERFYSTYLEDCTDVKDFLGQLRFWRALMQANGKAINDCSFIKAILTRLPSEYHDFSSYYESLRQTYPFWGKITIDELDERLRSFEYQFQEQEAKTEEAKKALTDRRKLASSRTLDPESIHRGLKFTHLEDCRSMKDYLGRMFFWRRSLKEHGEEVTDSNFLDAIVKGLTHDYEQVGTHYLTLRSTPAFNEQILEEFANRLVAIERYLPMFKLDDPLFFNDWMIEDLRYRWGPANVIDIDWKIHGYFGRTPASVLLDVLSLMPGGQPYREGTEEFTRISCFVGVLLVFRHLIQHFRLVDVARWSFFVACIAGLEQFGLVFPFTSASLGFKIVLPLILLNGILVAKARGRVRGCRRAKTC